MFGDRHIISFLPSASTTCAHVGRGGAGNIASPPRQAEPNTSTPDQVSFPISPELSNYVYPPPPGMLASSSESSRKRRQRYYSSGRGGLGNLHPASEMAMFSFDEELEKLNKVQETIAPVYHIGRGGAGNYVGGTKSKPTDSWNSGSDDSSLSSSSTLMDGRSGFEAFRAKFERMRNKFPL